MPLINRENYTGLRAIGAESESRYDRAPSRSKPGNHVRRLFAFLIIFALGLSISLEAPNPLPALDRALRQFSAMVQRSLARAEPEPIDAKAAARLDDDLDWRMEKTPDGYRAYLAAHPNGAHALEAQAKLDGLLPPKPAPPPAPKAVLTVAPLVEVENEPRPKMGMAPDLFAVLENEWRPPETKIEVQTITRWREPRSRVVTRWVRERPRYHRRPSSWWPFFAWGGPRDPRDLRQWQFR